MNSRFLLLFIVLVITVAAAVQAQDWQQPPEVTVTEEPRTEKPPMPPQASGPADGAHAYPHQVPKVRTNMDSGQQVPQVPQQVPEAGEASAAKFVPQASQQSGLVPSSMRSIRDLWADLDKTFQHHMRQARQMLGEEMPSSFWPSSQRPSMIDLIHQLQEYPTRIGVPSHRIGHADMHEESDAFVITMDVPGLTKQNLQIKVTSDHDAYTGMAWDVIEVDGKRVVSQEKDIPVPSVAKYSLGGDVSSVPQAPKIGTVKGGAQNPVPVPEAGEQQKVPEAGAGGGQGGFKAPWPVPEVQSTQSFVATSSQDTTAPKVHIAERAVGEFRRRFVMPKRILHDSVKASLQNGVLKIVAPKMQPQKPDDSDYTEVNIE